MTSTYDYRREEAQPARQRRIALAASFAILLLALGGATTAAAATPPGASVVSVNYGAGNPFFDVTVAVPKDVDTAARSRGVDWAVRVEGRRS
ncbi:MAG: hypothetical protein ACYDHH_00800 [Solirubrobacteraceae bacterium]